MGVLAVGGLLVAAGSRRSTAISASPVRTRTTSGLRRGRGWSAVVPEPHGAGQQLLCPLHDRAPSQRQRGRAGEPEMERHGGRPADLAQAPGRAGRVHGRADPGARLQRLHSQRPVLDGRHRRQHHHPRDRPFTRRIPHRASPPCGVELHRLHLLHHFETLDPAPCERRKTARPRGGLVFSERPELRSAPRSSSPVPM